ncbi:MAG: SxtJ family membrane protein [Actinomycetota bacterium]|nr:SxtJ family membrane protein [Actinomycetota bacterium]
MEINKNPEKKDLMWFGALLPVFVALLGFVAGRRTGSVAAQLSIWVVGAGVAAGFWAVPGWRRPIFVGFGYLTYPIGWIVTKVLLLAVFLGVVTPTAILMRAFGKDLLSQEIERDRASYWIPRRRRPERDDYFRQF